MRSMIFARRLSIRTAILLSAIAVSLVGNRAAQAQTKIVEGIVSHGALQWPEYVAIELGWFKENDVDLDMIIAGGGAAQQLAAERSISATADFPISSAPPIKAHQSRS